MEKAIGHLVVYLDIDGVISNARTYAEYHELSLDGKFPLTQNSDDHDYIRFNQSDEYGFGVFSHSKAWGEIYDKSLIKQLRDAINEVADKHEVVIVSSGAGILSEDYKSSLNMEYFSDLWGLNIVDYHAYTGSLYSRYKGMIEHARSNYKWTNTHVILLDDLAFDGGLTPRTRGIYQVRHDKLIRRFTDVLVDAFRNKSMSFYEVSKLYKQWFGE